jgi:hypothetical protein
MRQVARTKMPTGEKPFSGGIASDEGAMEEWCRSEDVYRLEQKHEQLAQKHDRAVTENTKLVRENKKLMTDFQKALGETGELHSELDRAHKRIKRLEDSIRAGVEIKTVVTEHEIVTTRGGQYCDQSCGRRNDTAEGSMCALYGSLVARGLPDGSRSVERHQKCKDNEKVTGRECEND